MDDLQDDNNPTPTAPPSQDMGRVFTFAGITLKPFSTARMTAYWRICTDDISVLESAIYKVFICTQSPAQCDVARGVGASAFRVAATEWFEKLTHGHPERTAELLASADAIDKDLLDARSVEPDTKESGNVAR
jgi:hypothetical protein